jgi:flagellar basal-body rod modification protein FlgD
MTIASTTDVSPYNMPSNIKTAAQAKLDAENAVLNGNGGAMGQDAFLTLFTAQLKSQNPLDPMDNTAFVSQLAQFSQLEATTKMATSLSTMATASATDRMTTAANLIGKKVSIADGKAIVANGAAVSGNITLDKDVDSITLKVYSSTGKLVRTGEIGNQKKGDFPFAWDGKDTEGNALPDGAYRIEATTSVYGKQSKVAVSTLATVNSVAIDPTTGDLKLDLGSNTTVSLTEVKRVGI